MFDKKLLEKYEMTVGIECHVQLSTKTKLFSSADNDERERQANDCISPIDFGLPGMLPVLNHQAINLAVIAGKALGYKIANVSRFDRKHYFYPDLPKGYQISQLYMPIILGGKVQIPIDDGSFEVRINHAHLEEDAGKLTHQIGGSLVDLNRAGTPLIEIVSEPDIHSAAQAKAYALELYMLMTYAGVTRGDLYHGNMRFDVNLSVAPKGSTQLGTRTETKNLNSFRSVERVCCYEFTRQAEILEKGETVVQETRGWDEAKQRTTSQRSKEDAQDYRYMPDPDIPPIVLSDQEIEEIQASIPKLPAFYRGFLKPLGLDSTVINALLYSPSTCQLLNRVFEKTGDKNIVRRIALWFISILSENQVLESPEAGGPVMVGDDYLIELSGMVEDGELNSTAAKTVFLEMQRKAMAPREIAVNMNLIQINDQSETMGIIDAVLGDPAYAKAVVDFKSGNEKVLGFLVGQVMRLSGGKINPSLASKLIKERINQ